MTCHVVRYADVGCLTSATARAWRGTRGSRRRRGGWPFRPGLPECD
ncbi:MAG: hypothetical protein JWO38_2182 [Gemmataceae bacterium]|nr:hypothetical protein [Gemmataceae bacterium]